MNIVNMIPIVDRWLQHTVMGKAPISVAQIAKRHAKPVIAFSGCAAPDARRCNEHGIDAYFPILRQITTLPEAMEPDNARQNLTDTAEQVFCLLRISTAQYLDNVCST